MKALVDVELRSIVCTLKRSPLRHLATYFKQTLHVTLFLLVLIFIILMQALILFPININLFLMRLLVSVSSIFQLSYFDESVLEIFIN